MEIETGCGSDRHHFKRAGDQIFCTYCGNVKSHSGVSDLVERLDAFEKKFTPPTYQEKQEREKEVRLKQIDLANGLGKFVAHEARKCQVTVLPVVLTEKESTIIVEDREEEMDEPD